MNLAANQWIDDVKRLQFPNENISIPRDFHEKQKVGRKFLTDLRISLKPMQIRTFLMSWNELKPSRLYMSEYVNSRSTYVKILPFIIIAILLIWKLGKKFRFWRICKRNSNQVHHQKLKPLSFAE